MDRPSEEMREEIRHAFDGQYHIHTNLEAAASWMHEQLDDAGTTVEEVLETLQWAAGETTPPRYLG